MITLSPSRAALCPLVFATVTDRDEFYSYPPGEQESIKARFAAMLRIEAAKNPNQGCIAEHVAGTLTMARVTSIRRLFDGWIAADRDWRSLVNKQKFPASREAELPPDFVAQVIHAKFCENQRKNKPAWRKIKRQWENWYQTGDARYALPGYDVCPPPGPRRKYPVGWSYENMNEHRPRRAVLTMARIGSHAARAALPFIPGTREGARFLEYVSGDDVQLDRKAYVPGFGPCRILQFGFMDYGASFYLEEFIQRPMLPRRDGTTEMYTRRDFLWAVALLLETHGYPLDWKMHLLLERGTATLSLAEIRFLHEISEGQIIGGYSSMEGEFVAAWEERRTGNSRAKGCHESFHNLYHNECADLPGQTGKDRDHAPAIMAAQERHTMLLDNVVVQLPAAEQAKVIVPYPNPTACLLQSKQRVMWLNDRNLHDCEGFSSVMEWRPRGFASLPRPEHELAAWLEQNGDMARLIAADPDAADRLIEWFPRLETPRERARRLAAQGRFQMLPPAAMRRFYEDLHEIVRVRDDFSIEFTRDKRRLRFVPPEPDQILEPGTELLGFYRPDGEAIHLFAKTTERYLLTWPAEKRVRRDDVAGKQIAFRRKALFFEDALRQARDATEEQRETAQAAARNNAEVVNDNRDLLAPEGCTPVAQAVQAVTAGMAEGRRMKAESARAEAEHLRRDAGDISEFLPGDGAGAGEEPEAIADAADFLP